MSPKFSNCKEVTMRLFLSTILIAILLTSAAFAQEKEARFSQAVAKCILTNLDKAKSDDAARLLVLVCESLNQ